MHNSSFRGHHNIIFKCPYNMPLNRSTSVEDYNEATEDVADPEEDLQSFITNELFIDIMDDTTSATSGEGAFI